MAGALRAIIGTAGSRKSSTAFKMMDGRGVFVTFKGVPDFFDPPPMMDDSEAYLSGLPGYLKKYPCFQIRVDTHILRVVEILRQYENIVVCYDDFYQLTQRDECGKPGRVFDVFDGYLREIRQKNHTVLITTHRLVNDLPVFVQENAEVFYCGPCQKKSTLQDLLDVNDVYPTDEAFIAALKENPPYNPLLIKKAVF